MVRLPDEPVRVGLLDEFDAALLAIAANPRLHPLAEDGVPGIEVREYLTARFDQRVIPRVLAPDVLVISVVHAARRPAAWHRRLNDTN